MCHPFSQSARDPRQGWANLQLQSWKLIHKVSPLQHLQAGRSYKGETLSCSGSVSNSEVVNIHLCRLLPRWVYLFRDQDRDRSTLLLLLFAGTIFCEFLRFGKNRKFKYPQKFLPTHQACNIKSETGFPFLNVHNHILFDRCCLFFLPSCAITSSRKWRLMISMIVGVSCCYRIPGARCTMWHNSRNSTGKTTCIYIAATSAWTLPHLLSRQISKLSLYFCLRKIAKFSSTSCNRKN